MAVIHRYLGIPLGCLGLLMTTSLQAQEASPPNTPAPPTTVRASLDQDGHNAVDGVNAFSLDLYKREIKPGQNLLLSPASVSVAVGLAYRGAVGQTADELNRTLHFNAPPAEYLRADAQLLAAMNFSGPGYQLQSANSVWLRTGMPVKPDFEADIARYAKAGFARTDFGKDAEASRLTINRWVEDATHDKIRDLLHPGDVTSFTAAVLVNAIYWKGKWGRPFAKSATKVEPFTTADGKRVQTSLMHAEAKFHVLERAGVKGIRLPYQGGEVDMVIFLPNSPGGLSKFEQRLTWPDLKRWLDDLKDRSRQTIVTLPKLHLDWRSDLKGDLGSMGAPTAFGDEADFSGIATLPYPGGDPNASGLKIAHVIHQTTIDVEEEGTEAAAATAVVMDMIVTGRRAGPPPPPPFIFRADHPFLFALVDNRTGMILFMGRYVTPESTAP